MRATGGHARPQRGTYYARIQETKHCPRCNAVGDVHRASAGDEGFVIIWKKGGAFWSCDILVREPDLRDPGFGCGYDDGVMDLGKRGLRPSVRYVNKVWRALGHLYDTHVYWPTGIDREDVTGDPDTVIAMSLVARGALLAAIDAWNEHRWIEFCACARAARGPISVLATQLRSGRAAFTRTALRALLSPLPDESP